MLELRMAVSSAKIEAIQLSKGGKSDVNILYNNGERQEPWGQPAGIEIKSDVVFPMCTLKLLSFKKLCIIHTSSFGKR